MATKNLTQDVIFLFSALGVTLSIIFSLIVYIWHNKIKDIENINSQFRETLLILFDKVDQLTKKINCVKIEQGKQIERVSSIEKSCNKNHN